MSLQKIPLGMAIGERVLAARFRIGLLGQQKTHELQLRHQMVGIVLLPFAELDVEVLVKAEEFFQNIPAGQLTSSIVVLVQRTGRGYIERVDIRGFKLILREGGEGGTPEIHFQGQFLHQDFQFFSHPFIAHNLAKFPFGITEAPAKEAVDLMDFDRPAGLYDLGILCSHGIHWYSLTRPTYSPWTYTATASRTGSSPAAPLQVSRTACP